MAKIRSSSDDPLQVAIRHTLVELREDLAQLRSTVEQLHDDLQFVLTVPAPRPLSPRLRITSLPKDPTAADFFDRINAVPPEQIEAMRAEVVRSASQTADKGSV